MFALASVLFIISLQLYLLKCHRLLFLSFEISQKLKRSFYFEGNLGPSLISFLLNCNWKFSHHLIYIVIEATMIPTKRRTVNSATWLWCPWSTTVTSMTKISQGALVALILVISNSSVTEVIAHSTQRKSLLIM